MPKNKGVKGEIGIKDKVTPTLKNIVKEQQNFRRDVKKTHTVMKELYGFTEPVYLAFIVIIPSS